MLQRNASLLFIVRQNYLTAAMAVEPVFLLLLQIYVTSHTAGQIVHVLNITPNARLHNIDLYNLF